MSKPIKDTFWTRLWWLVRGVLFYNTVYWKRASDEARPPRISQRERREMMPVRDFNFIKPRAVSREKINGEILPVPPVSAKIKPPPVAASPRLELTAEEANVAPAPSAAPAEEVPKEPLKKRRYSYHRTSHRRHHRAKINPADPFASPESGGSLIKRLFGKKE